MKFYLLNGLMPLILVLAACTSPVENPAEADEGAVSSEAHAAPRRVFEASAGTVLTFTLIDSLSTEHSMAGDTFEASLTDALVIEGETIVPRNAMARGRVLAAEEPGRVSGLARMELLITELQVGSEMVQLRTQPLVMQAEATKSEDATKIGVGAGIGAGIGAALGGGKGAAMGAAIGGGSGTAVVLATRGDQVELPSESRLEFKLEEALEITRS